MADSRYYKSSKIVPLGGFFKTGLMGIVSAAIGGALYAVLDFYNPFIYVNILATIGLGAIIGAMVSMGSTSGHVRNSLVSHLAVLASAAFGLYISWVTFIYLLSGVDSLLVFDPLILVQIIDQIAEIGVWEMKGFQPKGWQLYGFWGVETLLIVGFAFSTGGGSEDPYCVHTSASMVRWQSSPAFLARARGG